MKNNLFALLPIFLIILTSCNNQTNKNIEKNTNKYFCNVDSDCVIKDVHNCCGYFPKCVNKDYVPDITAVEKECKEKGAVSICGFPEISSCKCVKNTCESFQ